MDILAISPHPDDVELFIGGTTRHLVQLGYRVAILDLTRGEAATRGTPEIRAHEAAAAAQVLGVDRHQLGLPDGGVHADNPDHVAALVAFLRMHRPELVLAPWTEERHPDHEAAGRLALRAQFLASAGGYRPDLGARHVIRELVHYPMRVLPTPSFVVDIAHVLDIKRQAIACHASQLAALAGAPVTLVASSIGTLQTRDAFYGAHIGSLAGEPFIVRSTLAIADPLAHFRARPGTPHFFGAKA